MPAQIVMPTEKEPEELLIAGRSVSSPEAGVDQNAIEDESETVHVRSISADRLSGYRLLSKDGPTEPDHLAERDIDNASPMTVELCQRHPCHYCIFVHAGGNLVRKNLVIYIWLASCRF